MMFKALINHLAQQVNQDTMNYLQAGQGESWSPERTTRGQADF
jgi:hypothetical protein